MWQGGAPVRSAPIGAPANPPPDGERSVTPPDPAVTRRAARRPPSGVDQQSDEATSPGHCRRWNLYEPRPTSSLTPSTLTV